MNATAPAPLRPAKHTAGPTVPTEIPARDLVLRALDELAIASDDPALAARCLDAAEAMKDGAADGPVVRSGGGRPRTIASMIDGDTPDGQDVVDRGRLAILLLRCLPWDCQ